MENCSIMRYNFIITLFFSLTKQKHKYACTCHMEIINFSMSIFHRVVPLFWQTAPLGISVLFNRSFSIDFSSINVQTFFKFHSVCICSTSASLLQVWALKQLWEFHQGCPHARFRWNEAQFSSYYLLHIVTLKGSISNSGYTCFCNNHLTDWITCPKKSVAPPLALSASVWPNEMSLWQRPRVPTSPLSPSFHHRHSVCISQMQQ